MLEFIDTRNSYPRDSLIATRKTPRKYYLKENSEIYLVIIPDLQSLVVSSNGQFYTKQLMGDNYNDITNGFKNNFSASTKFDGMTTLLTLLNTKTNNSKTSSI
jgi:hypothetical protein